MATSQERRLDRPEVIVFDVNQTLSDMSPMRARFEDIGAPAHAAERWFAELLRDGFALTTVGAHASFADVGAETLRTTLDRSALNRELEDAVSHVMTGFDQLPLHADVPEGVRALRTLGVRLVTMSNGAASVAESLLQRAGVRDEFERVMSVEEAGTWKPARAAYAYAVAQCAVEPEQAMLVAVHPWDIDGASRAGLRTAWLNRSHQVYPNHFAGPDLRISSLRGLADRLH